jgi:hypothetical protein
VAFTGGASVGLIQTPNAFWKDASKGEKWYSGEYVAVLSPDLKQIRFSSYFSGGSALRLVAVPQGLLVVGRSAGQDDAEPATKSPALHALQEFKGQTDAHAVLLENPQP